MADRKLKIIIDQVGNAGPGLSSLTKGLGALGGVAAGVATAGIAVAGAGIVALGAGLFTSVNAAMEAQQGQAELQAVLESTKGVAGVTADAVNNLATKFQGLTMFEDDAILSGQNMLLTFTNIGKDVFPMATESMLNLAQKFGSMDQASVMLGKALNDPIAGVTALRRVGIQLTEAQELAITKFVEMGDIASAQKVILAEVETQVGGLAEAAGGTLPGKLAILQHTFGDIQETIGAAFLPALMSVADQLATGLKSDQAQVALTAMTGFITDSVVPGIEALMVFVGQAMALFLQWSSTLSQTTGPAMVMIRDALDRISVATGGATGKLSLSKIALAALKATLDAVTIAVKVVALGFQAFATYIETMSAVTRTLIGVSNQLGSTLRSTMSSIRSGIDSVISAWNRLIDVMRRAADAIPDDLMPGSPTPFEMGLRGIASAAGAVGNQLPQAFAGVGTGGAGGLSLAGAGGAPVIVQFTYSPMISTADRIEAERVLKPFIEDGVRAANSKK